MQMPYVTMFCSHYVMQNLFQHQDDGLFAWSHFVMLNSFQHLSAENGW